MKTAALLTCLALAGCVDELGTERSSAGNLSPPQAMPVDAEIGASGPPIALDYSDGALFVWPSAPTPNTAGLAPAIGPIEVNVDGSGSAVPILETTDNDRALEASLGNNAVVFVRATGGVSLGDDGILYYERVVVFPGGEEQLLGSGACPLEATRVRCDREAGREVESDALAFNRGGFVGSDGNVYLLRCSAAAAFEQTCIVARVALDALFEPNAYRYHSVFQEWVEDRTVASAIPSELGALSLHPNPHHGGYYLSALNPFDNRLLLRRAETPVGPFGRTMSIGELETETPFPSGPLEVSSLSPDGGESLALVVFSDGQLSALTFAFHGEAR